MKMQPEHFAHLRERIETVLEANPDAADRYRRGDFPRADKCQDRQLRFNFDLLYAAVPSVWVCETLYPYLNDNHIQTALKAICPKL